MGIIDDWLNKTRGRALRTPISRDTEMRVRNDRVSRNSTGGDVPGLPGVKFSPDYQTALRKGVASHQQFHSPDRMNHPAIEWSKSMAGINNGPADRMKDDIYNDLRNRGISRDETGTFRISGMPQTGTRQKLGESIIPKTTSSALPSLSSNQIPGSTQAAKSPLTKGIPSPGLGTGGPIPTTPPTTVGGQVSGSSIADTVRNALGMPKGTTQAIPSGASLADTIRQTVAAGLKPQPVPNTSRTQPGVTPSPTTPPQVAPTPQPAPLPTPGTPVPPGTPTPTPPGGVGPNGLPLVELPTKLPPTGTTTTPAPTTSPAPTGNVPLSTGTGSLGSPGGDYAAVDQENANIESAATEFGVPADVLKAMAMIESGGAGANTGCRDDGYGDGPSCGMMQVKPEIWQDTVPGCGYDAIVNNTNNCNTRTAAAILKQGMEQCGGDYQCAITSIYFPAADPNGTDQGEYIAALEQHMAAINGAAPPTATPGAVGPNGLPLVELPTQIPGSAGRENVIVAPGGPAGQVPLDPVQPQMVMNGIPATGVFNQEPVIMENEQTLSYLEALYPGAGAAYLADNPYGFKDDQGIDMYCQYYDWNCTAHTGLDIPTNGSTEFNSLVNGTVICEGANGAGAGGYNCGSYDDVEGGVGNITILTPDGAAVTYGHSRQTYAGLGQEVTAGQPLGTSGNNNGYHIHLEVRLPINGENAPWVLVDPNAYFNGHYCNVGFCPY